MLVNLVRIQFFKLFHSRFVRWGAVVYLLATAAILFGIMAASYNTEFLSHTIFDNSTVDERKSFFVTLYLSFAVMATNIYVGGATIYLLANHYEHREKINVSGIVRSPLLWFTSELVAIVLFCLITSFYVLGTEYYMVKALNINGFYKLSGSNSLLLMCIGAFISILYFVDPCIPITKIFRKYSVSVAVSAAYLAIRYLFLLFLTAFVYGISTGNKEAEMNVLLNGTSSEAVATDSLGDQLTSFVLDPGDALVNLANGGTIHISKVILTLLLLARVIVYPAIGYFAARRKNEV